MERLTTRWNGNDFVFIGKRPRGFLCKSEFCDNAYNCEKIKDRSCPYLKMVDRLAAIEDILGDEYDLERLRELVEADREGRYMVVPSDYDGEMFKIWKGQILSSRRFVNNIKELGKTVFLTRAEAEAALRREQDG